MDGAVSDGKAVDAVEGFRPPAVQNRQIECAVEHDLLSAGSGGLMRPTRIVKPDIDAVHHVPADVDVVVLEERDPVYKSWIFPHAGDQLDQ